jgi:hypothetical protein
MRHDSRRPIALHFGANSGRAEIFGADDHQPVEQAPIYKLSDDTGGLGKILSWVEPPHAERKASGHTRPQLAPCGLDRRLRGAPPGSIEPEGNDVDPVR